MRVGCTDNDNDYFYDFFFYLKLYLAYVATKGSF